MNVKTEKTAARATASKNVPMLIITLRTKNRIFIPMSHKIPSRLQEKIKPGKRMVQLATPKKMSETKLAVKMQ